MFTLLMYVTGCSFSGCPIETYNVAYFAEEQACIKSRDIWRGLHPEWYNENWANVGECVKGKMPTWDELIANL